LLLVYESLYILVYNKESCKMLFRALIENGSHLWLLDCIIKDFSHKKNIEYGVKLLLLLNESEKCLKYMTKKNLHVLNHITETKNDELKHDIMILYLCLYYYEDTPSQMSNSSSIIKCIIDFFTNPRTTPTNSIPLLVLSNLISEDTIKDYTNQEFIKFLLATKITKTMHSSALHCGNLDGFIKLVSLLYNQQLLDIDLKILLEKLCELLLLYGTSLPVNQSIRASSSRSFQVLSLEGVDLLLKLLCRQFTKTPFAIYAKISEDTMLSSIGVMCQLLQQYMFEQLSVRYKSKNQVNVDTIILCIVKILYIPFVVELDQSLLYSILSSMYENNIIDNLVRISNHTKKQQLVIGLLARLVLTDEMFIPQMNNILKNTDEMAFIKTILTTTASDECEILNDLLAILAHIARYCADSFHTIIGLFTLEDGKITLFELLNHSRNNTIIRTCTLLGNLLKHSDNLYEEVKRHDVIPRLIAFIQKNNVALRKSTTLVFGNLAYHNDELYESLRLAIPVLSQLLQDNIAKVRANTVVAFGNFVRHSTKLYPTLFEYKVPTRILDVACNDNDVGVQDASLWVLRLYMQNQQCRKILLAADLRDKLTTLLEHSNPASLNLSRGLALSRASSIHSNISMAASRHCVKLLSQIKHMDLNGER